MQIGLLTTLATVYMGKQVTHMFFLITGWTHGMELKPVALEAAGPERIFGFRRVVV